MFRVLSSAGSRDKSGGTGSVSFTVHLWWWCGAMYSWVPPPDIKSTQKRLLSSVLLNMVPAVLAPATPATILLCFRMWPKSSRNARRSSLQGLISVNHRWVTGKPLRGKRYSSSHDRSFCHLVIIGGLCHFHCQRQHQQKNPSWPWKM